MDHQDSPLPIPPSTPLPSVLAWVGSPNYELKEKILAAARRDSKASYVPSQEPGPVSPTALPSGLQTRRPLRPIGSNSSKRPRHNDSFSSTLTDSSSSVSSTTTTTTTALNSTTITTAGSSTAVSSLAPGRQLTRSPPPLLLPERVLSRSTSTDGSPLPDRTTPSLTVDHEHQSEPWSLQKLLSEVDSRRTKQREQSARENANRTFNRVRSVDRSSSLSAGKTRSVERARTLGPESYGSGAGSVRLASTHHRSNGAVKQTSSIPSMTPRLDTLSSKSKSAPSFPYHYPQHSGQSQSQSQAQAQPQQAPSMGVRSSHQRDFRAISPLRPLSQITVSPKPMTSLGAGQGTTVGGPGSPLRSCLSPNRQGQKRKSSDQMSPSKRPQFAPMAELVAGPSRPGSQPQGQIRHEERQPLFLPSSPSSSQQLPPQPQPHTTTTTTTRRMTRQATYDSLPTLTTNQPSKPPSYVSPVPPQPPTITTTSAATTGATTMARSNQTTSKAHLYPPPKVPIGSRRITRQSQHQQQQQQQPEIQKREAQAETRKPIARPNEQDEEDEDGETSFDSFDGMFDALGAEGSKELEAVLRVVDGRG